MTDGPAPVSPEPVSPDEANLREQARAELQDFAEQLKVEMAARLDQKLDEWGAKIGSTPPSQGQSQTQ